MQGLSAEDASLIGPCTFCCSAVLHGYWILWAVLRNIFHIREDSVVDKYGMRRGSFDRQRDIVTVTAYPEHMHDIPGLTLACKKIWHAGKFLHQCGARRLSLTTGQMTQCIEAVQTAIAEAAPRVRELADAYPEFRDMGKRMLSEWEQGALDITPTVTAKSRAGDTLRHSVGLSDATNPRKAKKAVYRNPDGPFSHKSR
jgi:serine/threonine-protein kinase HipA